MGEDIIVGKSTRLELKGDTEDEEENDPTAEKDESNQIGRSIRYTVQDSSLSMRSNENGVIDRVMLSTNDKNNRFVKVRIRNIRIPHIGDKFSSRHGQKGTCGITYRQEVRFF